MTDPSMLDAAVDAAVRESERRHKLPLTRPGTILAIDPTNSLAEVVIDGDEDATGAQVVAPLGFFPGDRVIVLFTQPHGALVIGRKDGNFDDWHVIGQEDQPPFGTNWAAAPGTGALNEAGVDAVPAFRRRGRVIELRGRAQRPSVASGITIFTLPQNYWPQNDLTFIQTFGSTNTFGFVAVRNTTGNVDAVNGPSSSVDGPGGFVCLDGIMFSTDPPPE